MRGSWEESRKNRVGGALMTAARTPAGRGGPARPGRAAAERRGPALQKAAAGSPGRSHLLQGPAEAAAPPPAPETQASLRAAPAPPPAPGQTARPVGARGASRPRGPRPLRLRPLPAARSSAARLAGPAPGWGRDSATESGDGPPSGHRAAPRGLSDREDRRRWVWAEQSRAPGAPGCGGGQEGMGKRGALGLLWAVGSPGELLPTRSFWQVLDPPTTPATSRSPAWMSNGCPSASQRTRWGPWLR